MVELFHYWCNARGVECAVFRLKLSYFNWISADGFVVINLPHVWKFGAVDAHTHTQNDTHNKAKIQMADN